MNFKDKFDWRFRLETPILPLHNIMESGRCSCVVGNSEIKADEAIICGKGRPGKHPRTKNGVYDASDDLQQLATWHKQWPNANLGMPTGEITKRCVLDVDPAKGGMESLNILFPGGPPKTRTIKTGSGGFHFYFEYNSLYSKTIISLLPGIDFLSDNSYVIIPPSNHISGGVYSETDDHYEIALPDSLKAAITEKHKDVEEKGETSFSEPFYDGERDVKMAKLAGHLMYIQLADSIVWATLKAQNESFCRPPLEDRQLKNILESIRRQDDEHGYNKQEKKKKDDAPHFPLITFSDYMFEFALKETEWLIKDWLSWATNGFLVSLPGCYKSWFMSHMAYSVATGTPFLGRHEVVRPSPVIFIQQEDAHPITCQKFGLFMDTYQANKGEPDGDFDFPVYNMDFPLYMHKMRSLRLLDRGAMAGLREQIKKTKAKLVLIDPFYSIAEYDDYFAKAAGLMLEFKNWRDEFDCAVMIAHHSKKAAGLGDRWRDDILGSNLLNAWIETSWQIRPHGDNKTVRVLRTQKDGPVSPLIDVEWDITPYRVKTKETLVDADSDSDDDDDMNFPAAERRSSGKPQMTTSEKDAKIEKLIDLIRKGEIHSKTDVCQELEMSTTSATNLLNEIGARKRNGKYELRRDSQ